MQILRRQFEHDDPDFLPVVIQLLVVFRSLCHIEEAANKWNEESLKYELENFPEDEAVFSLEILGILF